MTPKKEPTRTFVWRLREFCEKKRNITNAYQLHQATGLTYPMCRKLWSGEQKLVGLNTMGTLCETLECKTTDFLGWTEG